MSVEEFKSQLEKHHIVPNRLLGQNFMIDFSLYPKLAQYTAINSRDVVLDAGAGLGFLTLFLAKRCKQVIAVEKDRTLARILNEQIHLPNVKIVEGDLLKADIPQFNKVVSIPPYYLSSQLVIWLLNRGFEIATIVVQREFANRLIAEVGSEEYGWITVVTHQAAETEILDVVPVSSFYPQPQVESVIVKLKTWATPPFEINNFALFMRLSKWLFSQRNKKLGNALVPFLRSEMKISKEEAKQKSLPFAISNKRVREMAPNEIGELSNALTR